MSQGKKKDLGREPLGKLLLSLALPAIMAQIVNMLYNLVDRMYIGRMEEVGSLALTGLGLVFPVIMIISAFSALIGAGGAPRAAIKMGEGNNEEAERILGNCFTLLICISVVLTVFFWVFGEKLLWMFGASADTMPFALSYLKTYVLGTIFVQIAIGLNAFISTQGFALVSMKTVMIGAVCNIILDPIFIFTFDMGVQGAALASVISQGISAVWVLRFLFGSKTTLRIKKKNLKVSKKVILPVLALGISPFIMQSTESLLNITFNSSLSLYGGDIAVGSMTIMASIKQMMFMPMVGLAQGAQAIISYNYGAKNNDRVRKAFKMLAISALTFTTTYWLMVMIAPQIPISLFTPDPVLRAETAWALRVYMAATVLMGAQMVCQQTFVALGAAKISLFLALLRKIILLIPMILILPYFFEDKVFAVFLAEPIADFIASITTITLFTLNFKRILADNE